VAKTLTSKRSVVQDGKDIMLASEMIRLDARIQVLQSETNLSYERLTRLYREIKGRSPPKGMLPFSVDWFIGWLPNVHSTVFYSLYIHLKKHVYAEKVRALIEAYKLYLEHAYAGRAAPGGDPVLSFTRAWMLVRFFDSNLLQLTQCEKCTGSFIDHAYDPQKGYVCGICQPPPRAGKPLLKVVVNPNYTGIERRSSDRPN